MGGAIAFFPWVRIDSPLTIGRLRLIPYQQAAKPGDLPLVAQADLDGIFAGYCTQPAIRIQRATLVEFGSWRLGENPEPSLESLFLVRNAVGFAALARRTFFGGHLNYCNFDTYSLAVQRFEPGNTSSFSFVTRRRDGQRTHLWASSDFPFHKPHHVESRSVLAVDETLVDALIHSAEDHVLEAINEFNCANTDDDIPPHVELVMMKSAFEWLFEIETGAHQFVDSVCGLAGPATSAPYEGPYAAKWKERWPNAKRPLEAWACDFCDIRGASAHGKDRAHSRFVWPAQAHLAFSSMLFPLLVKKMLAANGIYSLSSFDSDRLSQIEAYLMHNPFDFKFDFSKPDHHPWTSLDSEIRLGRLIASLKDND